MGETVAELENGYCRHRSAAAGHKWLDRYCYFGRRTYKIMSLPLRTVRYGHRSYDWTAGPRPGDMKEIETEKGSGDP